MKFVVAKKDGIACVGCNSHIMRGEDMVQSFMSTGSFNKVLCYHLSCYIPWYTNMFNHKWNDWKNTIGGQERSKLGRPPVITEPTTHDLLNRLRSSRVYHTKLGNDIRVTLINNKIKALLEAK